jgi:hypothetical protein
MGKPTFKLTIFWQIGKGIRIYLMFDHIGQQIVTLTTIWWGAKVRVKRLHLLGQKRPLFDLEDEGSTFLANTSTTLHGGI